MVKASAETTAGAVAVIELLAAQGAGSPLHVHSREDEWFYVIEGELTFWVGGERQRRSGRDVRLRAQGIPHTFVVSSSAGPIPARHRTGRVRELHAGRGSSRRSDLRSRRPPTDGTRHRPR